MNKKFSSLALTIFLASCAGSNGANAKEVTILPDNKKQVQSVEFSSSGSKMRIQLLSEDVIRFEYKYGGSYLEKNTFLIPNRDQYEGVNKCTKTTQGDLLIVETDNNTKITVNTKDVFTKYTGIKIERNGTTLYDNTGTGVPETNNGTLPGPEETPNAFVVVDNPRIVIPEHGYNPKSEAEQGGKFANNCGYDIQSTYDTYILLPEKNPKKFMQQYVDLTGKTEMVRLSTLGAWDSRYYEYNENSAQLELDNYHKFDLPIDNMVIDTDWRKAEAGIGYDVNTNLFPDMKEFISKMHDQNIEICFNDHPEPVLIDGKRAQVFNPREVKYRSENLSKILDLGLDYWWYDRNWGTTLVSPVENLISHETFGDYLYNDVTRQYNEKNYQIGDSYRRPIIMCNVNNINSGYRERIKDTASHRYSIQWTGDISPLSLSQEIENVIYSGNSSIPYMSSDLSGHTGVCNDAMYNRWIQYGALSPIFRIHCTRDLDIHCQPWFRDPSGTNGIMNNFRNFSDMRYRLLPYFYSLSHENYETGMPICRSLGFNYDVDNENKDYLKKEWTVGDNILFAPLTKDYKDVPFKYDVNYVAYHNMELRETDDKYVGTLSGSAASPAKINFSNVSDGFHLPEAWHNLNYSIRMDTRVDVPADSNPILLSASADDGVRMFIRKHDSGEPFKKVIDGWKDQAETQYVASEALEPGSNYDVRVEYYQNANDAVLRIKEVNDDTEGENFQIYIPEGSWYDIVHGNVITSTGEVKDLVYTNYQAPIFIKLGSATHFVETTKNSHDIDWNDIAFDIYPSNQDSAPLTTNTIYEDDLNSVSYKNGAFRKIPYSYQKEAGVSIFTINKAEGEYDEDILTSSKTYKLRYHLVNNESIDTLKVKLNGVNVPFTVNEATTEYTMPFKFDGQVYKHKVLDIEVNVMDVKEDNLVFTFTNN